MFAKHAEKVSMTFADTKTISTSTQELSHMPANTAMQLLPAGEPWADMFELFMKEGKGINNCAQE